MMYMVLSNQSSSTSSTRGVRSLCRALLPDGAAGSDFAAVAFSVILDFPLGAFEAFFDPFFFFCCCMYQYSAKGKDFTADD